MARACRSIGATPRRLGFARHDVLLAVLPGLESNRGLIAKEVLALLPRHAWLVNVGRGSTVDEDALLLVSENLRRFSVGEQLLNLVTRA